MKKMILIAGLFISMTYSFGQLKADEHYLLIGTYTTGKSEGVYVYRFNSKSGEFSYVSTARNCKNPSYLTVAPGEKNVYVVNETNSKTGFGGQVTAFSFDKKDGKLTEINKQASGGNDPCFITVDHTGKWAFIANYSSGTASVLPIRKDGSLDSASTIIQDEGSGVNSDRQEGPHAHSAVLTSDNKYLFIQDLGIDKIQIYSFDQKSGRLTPAPTPYIEVEPGSGPRHFEFHPNNHYAYLMEELSGSISVYHYQGKGQLELVQNISALPPEYTGPVGSADIHVSKDGRFVYASNRGESNTIAIFSVDQKTGMLKLVGHQPVLGKTPRNFSIDPSGNFLLVANQNSDAVIIFKRDKQTGLLSDTGKKIEVGNPVCVKWID